ncbi:MAG: hypothetical protein HC782_03750, partial [Gammaproteobacteria bacterium]|nr:hypothetical protein [Gammaproteobacteria bacterium]
MMQLRRQAISGGRASVGMWYGEALQYRWSLDASIGFLLPISLAVETTCAAGVRNQIMPGEMLIIHRGDADHFNLNL